MLGRLRRAIFGISPQETSTERRGFAVTDGAVRRRLETIGRAFVDGYHAALETPRPQALADRLNRIDDELRGFAYEGAGMGLTLLDLIFPWRRRLHNFYRGPGANHAYMIQIGAGWALARLRRPARPWIDRLDPVTRWLALDGYGFHEGYFDWQNTIDRCEQPSRLQEYERRGFDQGLGRCLWFVKGASVDRITATILSFADARRADLWSGVGLAATYAGGVEPHVLTNLVDAAGEEFHAPLAQGAVFAAKTRLRAGNPTPYTALACQIISDLSLEQAAFLFDDAGRDLPADGNEPAFEIWRQRIQSQFVDRRINAPRKTTEQEVYLI